MAWSSTRGQTIGGRSAQHPRGGSDTMLKSNGPNSISKDALRDEDYSWLINCTTQEYLVNVGQDSHFNKDCPHSKVSMPENIKT